MKVMSVVGARPQFVKAALLSPAIRGRAHEILVHTGQHYDAAMSDVFLREFELRPAVNLGIGSGPHGAQTGRMLEALEAVMRERGPDAVVVFGDTNSTLAGSLAAAKLSIPVAHVEAGLRSFDRSMPEEVNRIAADHLSSLLFAPTRAAVANLRSEGAAARVRLVGDVMVELLRGSLPRTSESVPRRFGVEPGGYALCTLHRPANVDDPRVLRTLLRALRASLVPVLLPLHPRTRDRIEGSGLVRLLGGNIIAIPPVGYLDSISLVRYSSRVVTDSGGLQKEAHVLRRPCVTVRDRTEWVETVASGWNRLAPPGTKELPRLVAGFSPSRPWRNLYAFPRPAERMAELLVRTMKKGRMHRA
jgi:UDP-N-acetylglucosamine 2-epimerase